MHISYASKSRKPNKATRLLIDRSNEILNAYYEKGFTLTVRQLYYQLVTRHKDFGNDIKNYNRLKSVLTKARECGEVDWDHLVDRSRPSYRRPVWFSGNQWLNDAKSEFALDPWEGQETRVKVFVEKDALSDVVGKGCSKHRVQYLPNKGYLSASTTWRMSRSMLASPCNHWIIIHLGDHDPSGTHMSTDLQSRLQLYATPTLVDTNERGYQPTQIEVRRIALNMPQVKKFKLVPDPAKPTDTRYPEYCDTYNTKSSWELDAMDPSDIVDLIEKAIDDILDKYCDRKKYEKILKNEKKILKKLDSLTL